MTADWRGDPPHQDTERKWLETGDVQFVLLAIGFWRSRPSWPEDAPEWALDACLAVFNKSFTGLEPPVRPTQGSRPYRSDYAIIEQLARTRSSPENDSFTTRELLRAILVERGLPEDEQLTALPRLMRYWGRETRDQEGVIRNKHVDRVAQNEAKRRGADRRPWELKQKT